MIEDTIPTFEGTIPAITTQQMVEVDRLMIEKYHIELIQMMENAGRGLALVAKEKFLIDSDAEDIKVAVLAGTGGNGGGAMVCARRLASWGYDVEVFVTDAEKMTPVPAHQLDILKQMKVPVKTAHDLKEFVYSSLIIDGIIGYSIKGDPTGDAKWMIEWANAQDADVLSLDTPSGVDLTTGEIHDPTIEADATLTLALPKQGLFEPEVKSYRGDLFLGDLSVPPGLYLEPSLDLYVDARIFLGNDVIKID